MLINPNSAIKIPVRQLARARVINRLRAQGIRCRDMFEMDEIEPLVEDYLAQYGHQLVTEVRWLYRKQIREWEVQWKRSKHSRMEELTVG